MPRDISNPPEHVSRLLDERTHARRQRATSDASARYLRAQTKCETRSEGDHDGGVIGHAEELLLALYGRTHHVQRGRETCSAEKLPNFQRGGWVVDDTAVDREAGVCDKNVDVGRKSGF